MELMFKLLLPSQFIQFLREAKPVAGKLTLKIKDDVWLGYAFLASKRILDDRQLVQQARSRGLNYTTANIYQYRMETQRQDAQQKFNIEHLLMHDREHQLNGLIYKLYLAYSPDFTLERFLKDIRYRAPITPYLRSLDPGTLYNRDFLPKTILFRTLSEVADENSDLLRREIIATCHLLTDLFFQYLDPQKKLRLI